MRVLITLLILVSLIECVYSNTTKILAEYLSGYHIEYVMIHDKEGVELLSKKVTKKNYRKGLELVYENNGENELILTCVSVLHSYDESEKLLCLSYIGDLDDYVLDSYSPSHGFFPGYRWDDGRTFIELYEEGDRMETTYLDADFVLPSEHKKIEVNTTEESSVTMRIHFEELEQPILVREKIVENLIRIPAISDLTGKHIELAIVENQLESRRRLVQYYCSLDYEENEILLPEDEKYSYDVQVSNDRKIIIEADQVFNFYQFIFSNKNLEEEITSTWIFTGDIDQFESFRVPSFPNEVIDEYPFAGVAGQTHTFLYKLLASNNPTIELADLPSAHLFEDIDWRVKNCSYVIKQLRVE